MISNLGQLLSVLLAAEKQVNLVYEEATAQGVPPECNNALEATVDRIRDIAIRRIEQLSGVTWARIRAQTILRANIDPDNFCPRWQRTVAARA